MSDMHPPTEAKLAELDEEEARFRRSRRVLFVVGGAITALLVGALVLLVVVLLSVRETQLGGTPTGKRLLAAAERIQSCTTPERECAKRNQRETAGLIRDLMRANERAAAAAAACAARPDIAGYAELLACVVETTERP